MTHYLVQYDLDESFDDSTGFARVPVEDLEYDQGRYAHVLEALTTGTAYYVRVLAHNAAELGKGEQAFKYLWITIGGAATFVCVKAYEWSVEISHGYVLQSNGFWSFYYTAAGLHACHVIAGAIAMAIVAGQAKQNRELQRVELVGIYWHFVDVVWVLLFIFVYILGT